MWAAFSGRVPLSFACHYFFCALRDQAFIIPHLSIRLPRSHLLNRMADNSEKDQRGMKAIPKAPSPKASPVSAPPGDLIPMSAIFLPDPALAVREEAFGKDQQRRSARGHDRAVKLETKQLMKVEKQRGKVDKRVWSAREMGAGESNRSMKMKSKN